jgi:aspartate/tyrosine/aromatic aminotransferase
VCSSFSKNFGLYRERIGALTVIAKDSDAAKVVASQVKTTIRTNYSNPPSHGGSVVAEILKDEALRARWDGELAEMRERIKGMRTLFTQKMNAKLPGKDFSFIEKQNGMFSYTGLTGEQVDQLREEKSIYIVRDGRINVAGISTGNVDVLTDAIAAVLS